MDSFCPPASATFFPKLNSQNDERPICRCICHPQLSFAIRPISPIRPRPLGYWRSLWQFSPFSIWLFSAFFASLRSTLDRKLSVGRWKFSFSISVFQRLSISLVVRGLVVPARYHPVSPSITQYHKKTRSPTGRACWTYRNPERILI